ncbi:oligosaccharide flippase family protein [Nonlabens antarcticus]|uniref:oligosaccharide flippase family protein n=1 Tax=Nonlabens antarcticus TaxID=392714 RepID=UPI001891D11B|nr:oligosaccharide flippase family protein [Nonlabens antarcticus]
MFKPLKKLKSEEKTVAKNYSALMVLQGLNYVLPFLIIPFLERTLELERFGLVMLAQYVMALCVAATDFGFSTTAVREISLLKEKGSDYSTIYFKVFWARAVLLVVVFLLLCAFVFAIPRFAVEWEVYLLSYGMVIGQTILGDWFFQGIERMRLLTAVNAISKILFTVLLFVFISSPSDYIYVPIFNSIGYLSAGLVMLFLSLKYVKWQWPNFRNSQEFYKDSFHIFLSDISSQFTYAANGVVLGLFAGDSVVGIFSAFDKLMLAARKMYLPICQAVYPYMSRKPFIEKRILMRKLIAGATAIGVIGLLFVVFLGQWIVEFLYADPAIAANIHLLEWMGLIVLFVGLSLLFTNLYAPSRKLFHQRLWVMVSATIFNLILGFALVPYLGLTGTVITTISTEFLMLIVSAYFYLGDDNSKDKQVIVE